MADSPHRRIRFFGRSSAFPFGVARTIVALVAAFALVLLASCADDAPDTDPSAATGNSQSQTEPDSDTDATDQDEEPPAASVTCRTDDWDTQPKETELGLAPELVAIASVTARVDANGCAEEILIAVPEVEDADWSAPTYIVEYTDQVFTEGEGAPVKVAGSHVINVIIGVPTGYFDPETFDYVPVYDPQDRDHLLEDAGVDMSKFESIKQVASAGSFEGQTSFAIGVDGEKPFEVEVVTPEDDPDNPGLLIRIAR